MARVPDQISTELENRAILFSIASGEYYQMNRLGTRIWALTDQPVTPREIVRTLLEEFAVEPSECERAVQEFLGRLHAANIITLTPATEQG